MALRDHFFLICLSVFILSLCSVDGVKAAIKWPKIKSHGLTMSWTNCGPSSDPVQVKTLLVSPDPIKLPGNFTISAAAGVAMAIPTDVQVSLVLERKIGPIFVKVPCIDNFGSCTYKNACSMWASFCPKYAEKYGLPCDCPIPANTYSVPDANIFVNSKPPPEFMGHYRATADLSASSGHIACVTLDLSVSE